MNDYVKLAIALGVRGLLGIVVAALLLGTGLPDGRRVGSSAAQGEFGATPICQTSASGSSGFYADTAVANLRMHERMGVQPSGDPDRDFARIMIPHHEAAIEMALVLLKYGRDERLRRLAQSIIIEQGQEIAYMRTLLAAPPGEVPETNRTTDQ